MPNFQVASFLFCVSLQMNLSFTNFAKLLSFFCVLLCFRKSWLKKQDPRYSDPKALWVKIAWKIVQTKSSENSSKTILWKNPQNIFKKILQHIMRTILKSILQHILQKIYKSTSGTRVIEVYFKSSVWLFPQCYRQ